MTKLRLNVVSLECAADARIEIGKFPYDKLKLDSLRKGNPNDYFFKRGGQNGQEIQAVKLRADAVDIGDDFETVRLSSSPWLLEPLAREALMRFFSDLRRPVLKWRPLLVLSLKPVNLLPADEDLPDWLQRRMVLALDTRSIGDGADKSSILTCGIRTRNIIEANCAAVLAAGIPIDGRYVSRRLIGTDPRIEDSLKIAGRVASVNGDSIELEDFGQGTSRVPLKDTFLEPRRENMDWCIRHLLGSRADRLIAMADVEAGKLWKGPGRLEQIRKTFDYLRSQNIELAPGVKMELGPLAGTTKASWSFTQEIIKKPTLVFDPSGTKTDAWNERGLDSYGPYDQRTFSPKQLHIAVICQAAHEGRVGGFLAKFLDGLPNIKVGNDRRPYEKGFIRRYALQAPKVQIFTAKSSGVTDYTAACRAALKASSDGGFEWNLAIAQIDKDFRELDVPDNPYYAVKAAFLRQRVPIQEMTLETMSLPDNQLVYALNNMSVATYAKIGGTPWLLKSGPTVVHELVVGIGSQTISTSRFGEQERVVGITTVFSSDGKYLLDDRTGAVPYNEYEDALFDTLSRAIERVRREDNWRSTDAVRLIFHVFKEVKDQEADAVGRLVEKLGLGEVKYAFVHVVDDHPFTVFDEDNAGVKYGSSIKGTYASERGLCISLNESERLLSFVGSREVKQPHHGIPQPTLLRLHRRSTFRDMTYISRQAFDFANHSWRMFSPAPLPITIHYAELIARLLAGLRDVPGWDQDTMLGPVGRTRWFL